MSGRNQSLTTREEEHNKQIAREKVAEDSKKLREEIIARDKAYSEGTDLKEQQRKAESELKVAVQKRRGAVDVLDETTEAILRSPVDLNLDELTDGMTARELYTHGEWMDHSPPQDGCYKIYDRRYDRYGVAEIKDNVVMFTNGGREYLIRNKKISWLRWWSTPIYFEPISSGVVGKVVDIEQDEE